MDDTTDDTTNTTPGATEPATLRGDPGGRAADGPPTRPVYDHPPEKVRGARLRHLARLALVENLFFALATLFSLAFALVILRQGVSDPRAIAYFVVLWVILAYLALPRVHRILTALYVPDYFIGRARTTDGLLGDPVNVAFIGAEDAIHAAMRRAGWAEADPVTLATSVRIVAASLARRHYPRAPVSPLVLFGRIQAFAYQQEIDGHPSQRHHVRFWPCPKDWPLPGGHRVDWLASGTYDRGVGLSLFTLQVTHKIDRDIDVERDYIVETITDANPQASVRTLEDFSTGYHSRNGGGDVIRTDGNLPVVDVRALTPDPADDADRRRLDRPDLLHAVGARPFSVVAAAVLALSSVLLSVGLAARDALGSDPAVPLTERGTPANEAAAVLWAALIVLALVCAGLALLAWLTYEGHQWARLVMLVLLSGALVGHFLQYLGGERPALPALAALSLDLLTIYALTSRSARDWTQTARSRRRG